MMQVWGMSGFGVFGAVWDRYWICSWRYSWARSLLRTWRRVNSRTKTASIKTTTTMTTTRKTRTSRRARTTRLWPPSSVFSAGSSSWRCGLALWDDGSRCWWMVLDGSTAMVGWLWHQRLTPHATWRPPAVHTAYLPLYSHLSQPCLLTVTTHRLLETVISCVTLTLGRFLSIHFLRGLSVYSVQMFASFPNLHGSVQTLEVTAECSMSKGFSYLFFTLTQ